MFDSNVSFDGLCIAQTNRLSDVWPILTTYGYKELNEKQALDTSTHVYI